MGKQEWGFKENHELHAAAAFTIRNILEAIMGNIDEKRSGKPMIHLGHDLPYDITNDNVFVTAGANHAIEVVLTVLARPGANILFPRPNYPVYEARARFSQLEVRHFDLLPEKGWEVDLDGVKSLADSKTVAIVLINAGNPCRNVFTFDHMKKVQFFNCGNSKRTWEILVIADEVYAHQVFGEKPFIPMGVLGDIAPVLTLGSLSKRWNVPGWRFGWIAINDPTIILQLNMSYQVAGSLKSCLTISADPPIVIQGAIPRVIKSTPKSFFLNTNKLLKESADMFFEKVKEIPLVACPHKPEGSMFAMVKLNIPAFEDVVDDTDFCMKLAKEECMIVFPGDAVCLKNWVRVSIASEPKVLEDAIGRMKAFCLKHAKHQ
ncbi:hypothetical protein L1987_37938 [Smallanthus sonchifolius]|uniref:Uncharacterized protein n=1 Tax=Smallanthus sonchifolius TaxID=185202 RepID=A0ACB9HI43_9ASTR|nr:hypothetical protein L1987_37938 [Smallanthus sonchifolius]